MYGGYGMNMMQGQGMMQPMQLEIPLKEGAGQVNLMTVYPGKVVLRSRADYENLWKHLSSYREANQFAKEEDYQEFVSATYYGMPKNMGMGDWTGSFQDGKHPYWWGEGVKPMYQHKNVDPISKELLDRKQIDETIVYAPQGTIFSLKRINLKICLCIFIISFTFVLNFLIHQINLINQNRNLQQIITESIYL